MNNLADPAALGPGIAVAFVATIYGVAWRIFFPPMASKLKTIARRPDPVPGMLLDGSSSIAEGENPWRSPVSSKAT